MSTPDIIWVAIIAVGVITEVVALVTKAQGDTLSERTRDWFRIRTSRVGRTIFTVAWIVFSLWFLGHILT